MLLDKTTAHQKPKGHGTLENTDIAITNSYLPREFEVRNVIIC